MNIKQKKINKSALVVLSVLSTASFFVYHLLLDQHYRLNADEYACMSYAKNGILGIGYAWRFYLTREGNFLSFLLQGVGMHALAHGFPPILFFFTLKCGLWLAIYWFFHTLFSQLGLLFDVASKITVASVFITCLYLISSNQSEIWHWAIGSMAYVLPIIFVLLSATFILRDQVYAALLPLAFLMQSRATYAVLFFAAVLLYFAYDYTINRARAKRNLSLSLVLLCLLLIYVFAPGNSARLPQVHFSSSFLMGQFFRELKNVFVSFNFAKLDRVAMGLLVMIPLLPKTPYSMNKRWVIIPGLLYLLFVLAHAGLFVLATGYAAWTRVLSMHSFLFLALCIFYAHFLYYRTNFAPRINLILSLFAFLILTANLYRKLPENLKKAETFSAAYDRQWERIFAYKGGETDTLILNIMPDPGVPCYFPFGEEPSYWINADFCKAYHLDFKIAREKKEVKKH